MDDFASPIYVLFFTLAGASLDISILTKVGLMGVAYIFARAAGKMLGSWVGAKSVKADPAVRKYLGLSLLPQGGGGNRAFSIGKTAAAAICNRYYNNYHV